MNICEHYHELYFISSESTNHISSYSMFCRVYQGVLSGIRSEHQYLQEMCSGKMPVRTVPLDKIMKVAAQDDDNRLMILWCNDQFELLVKMFLDVK